MSLLLQAAPERVTVSIGQVVETDLILAVAAPTQIGQVAETSAAQPIGQLVSGNLGRVSETGTVGAITVIMGEAPPVVFNPGPPDRPRRQLAVLGIKG